MTTINEHFDQLLDQANVTEDEARSYAYNFQHAAVERIFESDSTETERCDLDERTRRELVSSPWTSSSVRTGTPTRSCAGTGSPPKTRGRPSPTSGPATTGTSSARSSPPPPSPTATPEIGRASCRERVEIEEGSVASAENGER